MWIQLLLIAQEIEVGLMEKNWELGYLEQIDKRIYSVSLFIETRMIPTSWLAANLSGRK